MLEKGTVEDFISVKEQYQFKLDSEKETVISLLRRANIEFDSTSEMFTVSVKDESELNILIDQLRSSKISIQAIIPRKITLEDFFIDVIEDEKEK